VATLKKNLKAPRESDQIKAAALILEHSTRAVELWDLAQEVAELRRQMEELKHGTGQHPPAGGETQN